MMSEATELTQKASEFIRDILNRYTTEDIPTPKGKIIEVDSKADVLASYKLITDNHILSAPVKNVETGRYTGFLDVRELVKYAVFAAENEKKYGTLSEVVDNAKAMPQPLNGVTVTYLSALHPFRPVSKGTSLVKVADRLAHGVHRVPVLDPTNNKLVNIVSQSSIIALLGRHLGEHGTEQLEFPLNIVFSPGKKSTVNLVQAPVHAVREKDSALFMFKIMSKHGLSGLAVVNGEGKITGNTSSSDLKLWLKRGGQSLRQPIMDFLASIRRGEADPDASFSAETKAPIVTAHVRDTLAKVIAVLGKTRLHKVFVVDDLSRPIGVISLTDLLRVVSPTLKTASSNSSSSSN